jgi:hypothetical protein
MTKAAPPQKRCSNDRYKFGASACEVSISLKHPTGISLSLLDQPANSRIAGRLASASGQSGLRIA